MIKPTLEQVDAFCQHGHPKVDAMSFWLHYEAKGWKIGKTPMKNWRAAVANWDRMRQLKEEGNHVSKREQEFNAALERSRQDDLADEGLLKFPGRSDSRVPQGIHANGQRIRRVENG